jgi:hypothetical protein
MEAHLKLTVKIYHVDCTYWWFKFVLSYSLVLRLVLYGTYFYFSYNHATLVWAAGLQLYEVSNYEVLNYVVSHYSH